MKSSLFSEKFIIKNNVKFLKKRSTEFKKIIELIRNLRSELRNLNNTKFDLIIINKSRIKWIDDNENLIKLFFKINSPHYLVNYKGDLNFVSSGLKFAINYENIEKKNVGEREKKIKFYEKEVKFFEKKLKNKNFIDKAPINVVNENRAKLKDALKNLALLKK